LTIRTSCSVTQFPPWSSHSPVCTITAVSKDLVRRPTRISYDLSLATLSHELGVSFSRLRHDPPGSYSTSCGRPSMFVLRSMRKHPRDFWRTFSVNHSRTGAVKLLITRRTSQSSKLSGVPFAGLQPVPAAERAAIQPRSKRMTRPCASRTLLSSCLRGQCRPRCGDPGRPGEPTWPRPRPFVDRSYVPCAGQRYCAGH